MHCEHISVMARSRVGHFVESQIVEAIGVDYIDESEARAMARKISSLVGRNEREKNSSRLLPQKYFFLLLEIYR